MRNSRNALHITPTASGSYGQDDNGKIISFVDGMATDRRDLTDEMYENAALHDPNGRWQMIFGVNTLPEYRRRGYAEALLRQVAIDAKNAQKRACAEHARKGSFITTRSSGL